MNLGVKGKGEPRCWGRVRVNLGVKGKSRCEPMCWGRVRVNLGVGEG